MKMNSYKAASIIEGFCDFEPTDEQVTEAWQFLIDTGIVWSLQGWYGRKAMELIKSGVCVAPSGV